MSGFTQTTNELLYAYYGAGTPSVPTASPGVQMNVGYPPIIVPGGYMNNVGEHSSSLKLTGGGLMITSGSAPTWEFCLIMTTAQPGAYVASVAAGSLVGSTAATAPTSSITGATFSMEWNIGLRTLAVGAASTVTCFGQIWCPGAIASPGVMTIPASASSYSPQFTAWPTDQQVYLWPQLIITGGTAGNTITMEWMKLYGEN